MKEAFSRFSLLVGEEALEKLWQSRVCLFGIGGVGSWCAEALARSGVGHLTLVDNDKVSVSNINRQLVALTSTVGKYKTEVCAQRLRDINSEMDVKCINTFFLPENADTFDFSEYDYVIDAIDTVTAKLSLIKKAQDEGVKVISAMGAGNKLDPTFFKVADIYSTKVCPLAAVMRKESRKRGLMPYKVVYSEEKPFREVVKDGSRHAPGSAAFVPSSAGLIIASEVVKELIV
ncbi:MAG TPA: tRNA threonylcarbamoyladenosine dehydratase [Lachnospiraceae bacterium]|nr:tRNA threonylcarbamoyladenosine dehydratase [Lachnospiraceae bacterium]